MALPAIGIIGALLVMAPPRSASTARYVMALPFVCRSSFPHKNHLPNFLGSLSDQSPRMLAKFFLTFLGQAL